MNAIENTHERWENTPENRTALGNLRNAVFGEFNVGTAVPLSQRVAEQTGKQGTNMNSLNWDKIRWQDVQQDIKQRQWGRAVRTMFGWIFGDRRAVEGLGVYVRSMDSMPPENLRGIFTQIHQHLEDGPRVLDDELKRSAVGFETAFALGKKGYSLERTATRNTSVMIGNPPGLRLENYLTPAIAAKLRPRTAPLGPEVLGPLATFDRDLPVGAHLYKDREGFPLLISPQLIPPGQFPPVPVFVHRPETAISAGTNLRDAKINFLERSVKPGDIVIVSKGGATQNPLHRLFQNTQQLLNADRSGAFHGSHILTVGTSNVHHITQGHGRQSGSLSEMIRNHGYTAVTIARVPNPERAEALAKRMEEVAGRERRFNTQGLLGEGIRLVRERITKTLIPNAPQPPDNSSTDTSCICVDYATDAAEGLLPNLAACRTPADIARCQDVRLVYSVDLPITT